MKREMSARQFLLSTPSVSIYCLCLLPGRIVSLATMRSCSPSTSPPGSLLFEAFIIRTPAREQHQQHLGVESICAAQCSALQAAAIGDMLTVAPSCRHSRTPASWTTAATSATTAMPLSSMDLLACSQSFLPEWSLDELEVETCGVACSPTVSRYSLLCCCSSFGRRSTATTNTGGECEYPLTVAYQYIFTGRTFRLTPTMSVPENVCA